MFISKIFHFFILAVFLITVQTGVGNAQTSTQDQPKKPPVELETPDLSTPNGVWSQTSPRTQMILGIGDLVFLATVQMIEDPEFREVSRIYGVHSKYEEKAAAKYNEIKKKISDEEHAFHDTQTSKKSAEQTLANEENLIRLKSTELEKTKNLLTASQKETRLQTIKNRMKELYNEAVDGHSGSLDTPEGIYDGLPTVERTEALALPREYTELRKMPDLTLTEKEAIINQAQEDLRMVQVSRDLTLKNIQTFQQQINYHMAEIEKIKPSLMAAESEWSLSKQTLNVARENVEAVAKQKSIKRLRYKALRYGADFIFAIDLMSRIGYYVVGQSDPGWFPFGRFFRLVAP